MRLRPAIAALLALSAALASASPARAEGFGNLCEDELARVARGDVIVHLERTQAPLKRMRIVGQVAAPAADVYAVYTDYLHYPEIFGVKSSKVLCREGDTLKVSAVLVFPWPVGERWITNQTRLSPSTYEFSYERVDGSIQEYTGSLQIVPKGPNLCWVNYVACIDPGVPLVPRWLIDQVQQNIAPSTILLVRDYLKRKKDDN